MTTFPKMTVRSVVDQTVITFRPYQDSLFRAMARAVNNDKHPFLIAPPGAGKTLLMRTLAEHVLRHRRFRKVVISTPQNQIKQGFRRSCRVRACGSIYDLSVPLQQHAADLRTWLSNSQNTGVVLYCNATLTNARGHAASNPFQDVVDCSDILWIVDEAHHIEAPCLSKLLTWFRAHGGRVCYATATPFNENSLLSVLSDPDVDHAAFQPLGEHIHLGYAPDVKLEHVRVDGVQSHLTYLNYQPVVAAYWAKVISKKYTADGRPKMLLVIPPTYSGVEDKTTQDTAAALISALETRLPGVRCLNTVGPGLEIERRIEDEAKAACVGVGGHDIIVSCRRFEEGTDVPDISAVYIIGMRTDRQTIQLMGRALRNKHELPAAFAVRHPQYVDTAKIVFFLPRAHDRNLALSAIKVIAAVQVFTSYETITGPARVREAIQAKGRSKAHRAAADLVTTMTLCSSNTGIADATSLFSLLAGSRIGQLFKHAYAGGSDEAKNLLASIALGKLTDEGVQSVADKLIAASRNAKRRDEAQRQIATSVRGRLTSDPEVRAVLEGVVGQYASTSVKLDLDASAVSYVTYLGGDTIQNWANLLQSSLNRDQLRLRRLSEICDFKDKYRRDPSQVGDSLAEVKLGRSLSNLRMMFKELTSDDSRRMYTDFCVERGYPSMLPARDRLDDMKRRLRAVFDFMDTHAREPKERTRLRRAERILGYSLRRLREEASQSCSASERDELYKFSCQHRYPDILVRPESIRVVRGQSQSQLAAALRICDFKDAHNRDPRFNATDQAERSMASVLHRLRVQHQRTRDIETEEAVAARGYADLLTIVDNKSRLLRSIDDICDFRDKYGRAPQRTKSSSSESALCGKMRYLQVLYAKYTTGTPCPFDKQMYDLAQTRNCLDMLVARDRESDSAATVAAICEFKLKYGRIPAKQAADPEESSLGRALKMLRTSQRRATLTRPAVRAVIDKYDQHDMFNLPRHLSAEARQLPSSKSVKLQLWREECVRLLCAFKNTHGRYPLRRRTEMRLSLAYAQIRKLTCDEAPAVHKLAADLGCYDLFTVKMRTVDKHIREIPKICAFKDLHGKEPWYLRSVGADAQRLCVSLTYLRSRYKENDANVRTPEVAAMCAQHGHPGLLEGAA